MSELIIPPIEDAHLPVGAPDFSFITDRLAVGDVNSQAVPGFVAVVSVLSTERPGIVWSEWPCKPQPPDGTPVHLVDMADGEGPWFGADMHRLEDYLSETTRFIAEGLARGCVLVH